MKIERLSGESLSDVYNCIEENRQVMASEIAESTRYLKECVDRGWLTYAIYDDSGTPIGMAILTPSADALSPVSGEGIYHLQCMNIMKDRRKKRLGIRLIKRITKDVKALGGKGISVECYGEYWMPKTFFSRVGFEEVERLSHHSIYLKKIAPSANAASADLPYRGELPAEGIQVDIQHWVTCPFILNNYRKVASTVRRIVPNAAVYERTICTKEDVEKWGGSGVYVNGKSVSPGPVSEEDIRKAIQRERNH